MSKAPQGDTSPSDGIDKSTEVIELKDGSWQVIVTVPGRIPMNVAGFSNEADARIWIDKEFKGWLERLRSS